MFYEGEKHLTLPWRSILTLSIKGRAFTVHRTTAGAPHAFELSSSAEAKLAHLVASHLKNQQQQRAATPARKSTSRARPKEEAERRETGRQIRSTPAADDSPVGSTIELPHTGIFSVSVVGESHRQAALRIPVHREHSFRFKVNADSTDAEHRFRSS
jgi:hypothetical protein